MFNCILGKKAAAPSTGENLGKAEYTPPIPIPVTAVLRPKLAHAVYGLKPETQGPAPNSDPHFL